MDVTHHRFGIGDSVLVASFVKQNIHALTRLTASAGVAPNLFLSKIASDFKKPDGLTVVAPDRILDFLKNLPARKIPGVGPVTEEKLARLGVRTCGELARCGADILIKHFGKMGLVLHERANGRDEREVEPDVPAKQYSTEETFPADIRDMNFLRLKLREYAEDIFSSLKKRGQGGRTVVLKIKYHDFELITRSRTLDRFPSDSNAVYQIACELLENKTEAGKRPVRLLGLGISGLTEETEFSAINQKELFAQPNL